MNYFFKKEELTISFHGLFVIRIFSLNPHFTQLMREEYPNFILESPHSVEPDLEIYFGPFDKETLGPLSPFFCYEYGEDVVYGKKRYKTAVWEAALVGLKRKPTLLYFDGNKRSLLFFIGEILEPFMRLRLSNTKVALVHSSCVATDAGAVLVSGIRHTGKTLVMMKALLHGAHLLSDDYTFLTRDKIAWAYPKRVNLFLSHFREIPELKKSWKELPLSDRFWIRIFYLLRRVSRDYAVIGYQRFVTNLVRTISLKNQAPLKKIILLTRRPFANLELRRDLSSEETAGKLFANNRWEGNSFQKMMEAYRYENDCEFKIDWPQNEYKLIHEIVSGVNAVEIIIPDFSKENMTRYLQLALEAVFEK